MAKKAKIAPTAKAGVPTPGPITAAKPPSEADRLRNEAQQALNALMGPIPKFYANSFAVAQSASDVTLIFMLHNQPVSSVSMSYNSLKSLVVDFAKVIENFEKATKQKIKTINEIKNDMEKTLGKPI